MTAAYGLIAAVLLASMAVALFRAVRGPTLPDRMLAVNAFGTLTVLLITALGFLRGRSAFADIALLYALVNFVGTIALLKFFQFRDLGYTEEKEDR